MKTVNFCGKDFSPGQLFAPDFLAARVEDSVIRLARLLEVQDAQILDDGSARVGPYRVVPPGCLQVQTVRAARADYWKAGGPGWRALDQLIVAS